jgi:hypothetical protein
MASLPAMGAGLCGLAYCWQLYYITIPGLYES